VNNVAELPCECSDAAFWIVHHINRLKSEPLLYTREDYYNFG